MITSNWSYPIVGPLTSAFVMKSDYLITCKLTCEFNNQ